MDFQKLNLVQKAGYLLGSVPGVAVGGLVWTLDYGYRRIIMKESDLSADVGASKSAETVFDSCIELGVEVAPVAFTVLIEQLASRAINVTKVASKKLS